MLRTLAIASAPLVTVWTVTAAFAWCTNPERRGTLAVRRRDLRAPKPDGADGSGIVDLSRYAAAYALGIRVGGLVRGASYLLLITCALFHSSPILSLAGLAVAIWIGNRSHKAAGLAFFAGTGTVSVATIPDKLSLTCRSPGLHKRIVPNKFIQANVRPCLAQ